MPETVPNAKPPRPSASSQSSCVISVRLGDMSFLGWRNYLFFDELQAVSIRVTGEKTFGESEIFISDRGHARRNHSRSATIEFSRCGFDAGSPERCLPMP